MADEESIFVKDNQSLHADSIFRSALPLMQDGMFVVLSIGRGLL
jgi:hypothetical protein